MVPTGSRPSPLLGVTVIPRLSDPSGTYCGTTGAITDIVVTQTGSGYSFAPNLVIRNGTLYDPIPLNVNGTKATATATLYVQTVAMDTFGAGYIAPRRSPSATQGTGTGATATAFVDAGGVTSIDLIAGGSGYVTPAA